MKKKSLFFGLFVLPLLGVGQGNGSMAEGRLETGTVVEKSVLPVRAAGDYDNCNPQATPATFSASNGDLYTEGPSGWVYDPDDRTISVSASAGNAGRTPLLTPCVILDPGTYRINMWYAAGMKYTGMDPATGETYILRYYDRFSVRMGKPGSDVAFWDNIHIDDSGYTAGVRVERSFFLTVESRDTVQLAVVPKMLPEGPAKEDHVLDFTGFKLSFREIEVTRLYAEDMGLKRIESSLTHRVPAEQVNGSHDFTATVQNNGMEAKKAYLSFSLAGDPDRVLGLSDTVEIASEDRHVFRAKVALQGLKAGDADTVVARVHIPGSVDSNSFDNVRKYPILVSDSVMAYDMVDESLITTQYYPSTGALTSSITFGHLFTVSKADTLTSISLGLEDRPKTSPVTCRIFKWDPETQTKEYEMVSFSFDRPLLLGFYTYTFNPMILSPGVYFLEISQLTKSYIGILMDNEEDGYNWITSSSTGRTTKQQDIGFVAARFNFGHTDRDIPGRDMAVLEIPKPIGSGRFSANERVEAIIGNQGSENASTKVYCLVGGKLSEKTVSVPPFGKTTVDFTVDLNEGGEYEIKVFTALEGDLNRSNDTLVKTVMSLGEPDPYVMDFEYCEDFAITDLIPWSVRDVDTNATIGLTGYESMPHMGEKMAFMAVDPEQIPDFTRYFPSIQGRKYGLCMAANPGPNNDWLISPKLIMPESGAKMTFWTMRVDDYEVEEYNVLVSTTNALLSSFKKVTETKEAPTRWTEETVDLSEYNGQAIYIAIQCVSDFRFGFFVDDIRVSKPGVGTEASEEAIPFSVYPNPASDRISIRADVGGVNMLRVEILNPYGGLVFDSGRINTASFSLNVGEWPSGLYFARVTTPQGVRTLKFLVR